MPRGLVVLAILIIVSRVAAAQTPAARLDDAQASHVLRFLRAVAATDTSTARLLVDSVMAAKGTALIIAQQNVSRRVTSDEYREVLLSLAEHRAPRFASPPANARAAKGREGPSLPLPASRRNARDRRAAE